MDNRIKQIEEFDTFLARIYQNLSKAELQLHTAHALQMEFDKYAEQLEEIVKQLEAPVRGKRPYHLI